MSLQFDSVCNDKKIELASGMGAALISQGGKMVFNFLKNKESKFMTISKVSNTGDDLFDKNTLQLPHLTYQSAAIVEGKETGVTLLSMCLKPILSDDKLAFQYVIDKLSFERSLAKTKSDDLFEIEIKIGFKYISVRGGERKEINLEEQTIELDNLSFKDSESGAKSGWFISPFTEKGAQTNGGAYEVSIEVIMVNKRRVKIQKAIEFYEKNSEPINNLVKVVVE